MAFVFREPKMKTSFSKGSVGPGSYQSFIAKKSNESYAPFNTRQRRSKPKNKIQLPGPGYYDTTASSQKLLLSSASDHIKILQLPKQQYFFSSESNRFPASRFNTPGPGQYIQNTLLLGRNQSSQQKRRRQSSDYILSRSKSIPSISTQNFGYVQKKGKLVRLHSPQERFDGTPASSVGVGRYQNKPISNRVKGLPWCRVKGERVLFQNNKISLGPAHYDLNNKKPQASPKKKCRATVSQLGRKKSKGRLNQLLQLKSTLLQTENQHLQQKIVYIDSISPGPGYYHNQQKSTAFVKAFKPQQHQCFGSFQERFKTYETSPLGPGQYEINQSKTLQSHNPGFNSTEYRFGLTTAKSSSPPPTHYDSRNNIADSLKKKVLNMSKGPFGSTQSRFRNTMPQEQKPGPCEYEIPNPINKQISSVFNSQTQRVETSANLFRSKCPGPGDYFKQNQQNKVLIKKPPFGTSMARFRQPKIQNNQVSQKQQQIQQLLQKAFKPGNRRKPSSKPRSQATEMRRHFNSTESRFNGGMILAGQENNPGPGQYINTQQQRATTFNILFL